MNAISKLPEISPLPMLARRINVLDAPMRLDMPKPGKPKPSRRKPKDRVTLSWDEETIQLAQEGSKRFPFNGNVSLYTRWLVKRDKESPKTAVFLTDEERAEFQIYMRAKENAPNGP